MAYKEISNLELEIMDIVWEEGEVSIRDVLEKQSSKKLLAYNTIGTILQRLEQKGFVKKKIIKFPHTFTAKITKASYGRNVVDGFLKKYLESFGTSGMASFAESIENLPQLEKQELLHILEKHEKHQ